MLGKEEAAAYTHSLLDSPDRNTRDDSPDISQIRNRFSQDQEATPLQGTTYLSDN